MPMVWNRFKKQCWWLRMVETLLAVLLLLTGLNFLLQSGWAHRTPAFRPEGEPVALMPILSKQDLKHEDYDLIFQQTGLSQTAVNDLLQYGEKGMKTILDAQEAFFSAVEPNCTTLIFGRFTCEDLLQDEEGDSIYASPIAPLQPGDIMVSFSTHTWGWRHGHAGLVVDAADGLSLEAAQLGVNTYTAHVDHWRNYSNFMVLRVKDSSVQQRQQVVDFALESLNDVPYSLLSGVFGPKDQSGKKELKAQCAYLPWRAWQAAGVDLDGDGGKIVTVRDLVESGAVEIVQVYGVDPDLVMNRQSRS